MIKPVLVQIIGAPVACKEDVKDSLRAVARWAEGQLTAHFGNDVQVKYYDLFEADCPSMPAGSQLPLVLVDSEVVINGAKISIPLIRGRITTLLEKEIA